MRRGLTLLALLLCSIPAAAQDRAVPYWAALRAGEVNMRVGPSEDFPIEWVYRRQGLPVKVLRVMQGWRLVEDPTARGAGSSPACSRPTAARWSSATGSPRCARQGFGRPGAVARRAGRGRRARRL
jgi:hypothetical protein